jgi:1-acyl-sn-glycerol-3-phosphate acyltransferase
MFKRSRLARLLFGLYCILPFAFSFLVMIPLYFLIFNFGGKRAPVIAHKLSRVWAAFLLLAFFLKVRIRNKEYIDPKSEYVFIANHLSMLDIPVYAVACKNTFRFLAKAELGKAPLLGYVVRKLYITVNRGDKTDRAKSIEKMKKSLQEGISIFLAPEGTRNKTEEPLLPFRDGAFLLAIASGKPLAVLTILNSHEHLSPAHMLELMPGTIYAVWSKPVPTEGMTEKDIPELKEKVRNMMLAILDQRKPGRSPADIREEVPYQ